MITSGPVILNRYDMNWTQKKVEQKLLSNRDLNSFLSRQKGYLLLTVKGTRVVILREDVGVSYYFLYPIINLSDAIVVNDFMLYAIPYLNSKLEDGENDYLYTPHPRVNI